jgi:predicted  nucleic acid-binding Zn-ribbon protein
MIHFAQQGSELLRHDSPLQTTFLHNIIAIANIFFNIILLINFLFHCPRFLSFLFPFFLAQLKEAYDRIERVERNIYSCNKGIEETKVDISEFKENIQNRVVKIKGEICEIRGVINNFNNEFRKIRMRENLSLGIIESIKDEQVNLKKQYMKLFNELEDIKSKMGNING